MPTSALSKGPQHHNECYAPDTDVQYTFGPPRFYSKGQKLDVKSQTRESEDRYTRYTDACRGFGKTLMPFCYAARVTHAVRFGVIACDFKDRELN